MLPEPLRISLVSSMIRSIVASKIRDRVDLSEAKSSCRNSVMDRQKGAFADDGFVSDSRWDAVRRWHPHAWAVFREGAPCDCVVALTRREGRRGESRGQPLYFAMRRSEGMPAHQKFC